MKKSILAIIPLLLILSCNPKNKEQTTDTVPLNTVEATDSVSGNYSYQNKDTVRLQISVSGEQAEGNLLISYFEKDRSQGSFSGKIENNILIADYTFQSEGVESVQQIAIKFEDGKAFLGYGEIEEDGNYVKFKDVSTLEFDMDFPLSKE